MWEIIRKAAEHNGLVAAFAIVGLIIWFSGVISRTLTFGRVHGSAIAIFIGLALAYTGLRTRFATHLLYLGPEFVRLQRTLFARKTNYDLPTAEIVHVKQAEFYRQNYRPVHGIEISAGKRRIRFGSTLSPDEKGWLCQEIRNFVRARGAVV